MFTPSRNFAAAFAIAAGLLGVLYLSERDKTSTLQAERDNAALVSQALAAPGAQVVPLSGPGGEGGGGVVLAAERKPLVVVRSAARSARQGLGGLDDSRRRRAGLGGLMKGGTENVVVAAGDASPEGRRSPSRAEPDDGTQHAAPTGSIALSGGVNS